MKFYYYKISNIKNDILLYLENKYNELLKSYILK